MTNLEELLIDDMLSSEERIVLREFYQGLIKERDAVLVKVHETEEQLLYRERTSKNNGLAAMIGLERMQELEEKNKQLQATCDRLTRANQAMVFHQGRSGELSKEVEQLKVICISAAHALRSYQYGNSSPALAKEVADMLDEYLK